MTNLSHIVHHMSFGAEPPRKVKTQVRNAHTNTQDTQDTHGSDYHLAQLLDKVWFVVRV